MTSDNQLTSSGPRDGSGAMFDAIAHRYDLLNRMISLGIDQGWRRRAVAALALGPDSKVLDLATGTGDLALQIARTHTDCQVTGVDPSTKMMEIGEQKTEAAGLDDRVRYQLGDAQALEFADGSFDGVTIAFGIRNVPDRELGLREMARVTRPGGKIVVLELSEPQRGLLAAGARFHMHTMVPWLGGLLSGSKEYRYLPQSISKFPAPHRFAEMMQQAGLRNVSHQPLTFGVCQLYVGEAA